MAFLYCFFAFRVSSRGVIRLSVFLFGVSSQGVFQLSGILSVVFSVFDGVFLPWVLLSDVFVFRYCAFVFGVFGHCAFVSGPRV